MSFALSKLLWACVSPGSLLAFLLAVGLGLSWGGRPALARVGRRVCGVVCLCLLLIAVLPVGEWALVPLENHVPAVLPESVDGVIVIGGDEQTDITEARGVPTALESLRRYMTFVDLSRRYPDAKLVFSGGSGFLLPRAHVTDSAVALAILGDLGVPQDRLVIEKTSRNTYENAVFSADIVRPERTQKWLLVTSAWHMPRALGCFRKAGWNIDAAPAGYFTTGQYRFYAAFSFDSQMRYLTMAVHEYIGLVSYWLMGRIDSPWP